MNRRGVLIIIPLLLLPHAAAGQSAQALALPKYESRYYVVYTDLPADHAREAVLRMTKMAEEYHARTRDFAGSIKSRLPFFLHSKHEDYLSNGGVDSTAGYFDGSKLVAWSGGRVGPDLRTWNTVQHEGFHQFVHTVMGRNIPSWVDEGLAEYFGEAIFTGDGYVSGVIPGWRAERIRQRLTEGAFAPTAEVVRWDLREWNSRMDLANYDHAWAMVQFLAHADGGRYRKAFAAYLNEVARGRPRDRAFVTHLGPVDQFDRAWRKFWDELPSDPTDRLYVQAWTAMLTSYLARATSQQQTFATFDELLAALDARKIAYHPQDWLPDSLARLAADRARADGERLSLQWSIDHSGKLPAVVCEFRDGSKLVGSFTLSGARVGKVSVTDRPR